MGYLMAVLLGYLLGCSNMAFYLTRLKKVDIRGAGSGNLGASNAVIVMGWKAGILVGIHDVGKSALAVLLTKMLFPQLQYAAAAAGVASVMGHVFPFYLKFKGGKGFASYMGMTLALDWKLAVAAVVLIAVITLIFDYIVLATAATTVMVPVWLGFAQQSVLLALILGIATVVIYYKHRHNFVRILNGTEIGLRSAHRGDHRAK